MPSRYSVATKCKYADISWVVGIKVFKLLLLLQKRFSSVNILSLKRNAPPLAQGSSSSPASHPVRQLISMHVSISTYPSNQRWLHFPFCEPLSVSLALLLLSSLGCLSVCFAHLFIYLSLVCIFNQPARANFRFLDAALCHRTKRGNILNCKLLKITGADIASVYTAVPCGSISDTKRYTFHV